MHIRLSFPQVKFEISSSSEPERGGKVMLYRYRLKVCSYDGTTLHEEMNCRYVELCDCLGNIFPLYLNTKRSTEVILTIAKEGGANNLSNYFEIKMDYNDSESESDEMNENDDALFYLEFIEEHLKPLLRLLDTEALKMRLTRLCNDQNNEDPILHESMNAETAVELQCGHVFNLKTLPRCDEKCPICRAHFCLGVYM
jgi:hypothetical protein